MYLSVRLSRSGRSAFLQKKLYEITRATHILKNGQPWEEVKGYKSGVPQISFTNIGNSKRLFMCVNDFVEDENTKAREMLQQFELECFGRLFELLY